MRTPHALGRDPRLQRGGEPADALRAALSGARCARHDLRGRSSSTTAAATARRRCCASNSQRRPDVTRVVLFNANYGQHHGDHRRLRALPRRARRHAGRRPAESAGGNRQAAGGDGRRPRLRRRRAARRARTRWWRRIASRAMNRLRERITHIRMTDQGCMLRAYSRDIVAAIAASREVSTFIPALAYTFAHNPTEVEVAHEERAAGESQYSLYKLIRLNFDLITGFSLVPLQLFSMFGMLVVGGGARDRLRRSSSSIAWSRRLAATRLGDALGPRHPRVLPDRHGAVRAGTHRRVRRPHLPAGARAAALHDPAPCSSATILAPTTRAPGHERRRAVSRAIPECGPIGLLRRRRLRLSRRRRALPARAPRARRRRARSWSRTRTIPGETLWFERVAATRARPRHRRRSPRPTRTRPESSRASARSRRISCSLSTTGSMLAAPLLACRARRAQHARLAAAALPRPRAGELGGAARRARDRRDAALHGRRSPTPATSSRSRPVPILPDDTARDVFDKVTVAAEIVLDGVLPGSSPARRRAVAQDLAAQGSYFGGRRPEDGRIDWSRARSGFTISCAPSRRPIPARCTTIGGVPRACCDARPRSSRAARRAGTRDRRRKNPRPLRRRRHARAVFAGNRRHGGRRLGVARALRRRTRGARPLIRPFTPCRACPSSPSHPSAFAASRRTVWRRLPTASSPWR